jgi:hypothetical protein
MMMLMSTTALFPLMAVIEQVPAPMGDRCRHRRAVSAVVVFHGAVRSKLNAFGRSHNRIAVAGMASDLMAYNLWYSSRYPAVLRSLGCLCFGGSAPARRRFDRIERKTIGARTPRPR